MCDEYRYSINARCVRHARDPCVLQCTTGCIQKLRNSGSHLFKTAPTADWNADGTRMGEGVHADVKQVEAPAGAAFICELTRAPIASFLHSLSRSLDRV